MNQPEIERIEQVRATLVEQREQYLQGIQHPVNHHTGKPLSRDTVKAFRKQVIRLNSVVSMHDRQIVRLRTWEAT